MITITYLILNVFDKKELAICGLQRVKKQLANISLYFEDVIIKGKIKARMNKIFARIEALLKKNI